MSDTSGSEIVKVVFALFEFGKKTIAEFNNRNSTERAKELLDINNNKRENFKRKQYSIPAESIHKAIENSIIFSTQEGRKITSTELDKLDGIRIIINECFKPFSPKETYSVTFKKKPVMDSLNTLFFKDYTYREEFEFKVQNHSSEFNAIMSEIPSGNLKENFFLDVLEKIIIATRYQGKQLRTIILSGDIGTGKTTAFARIMQGLVAKNSQENPVHLLPIDIDFEDIISIDDRESQNKKEYVENLYKKIDKKIESAIASTKTSVAKTKSITPIVFFDNLDLIYQKFCEDYFITPYGIKFSEIFFELIKKFLYGEKKLVLLCGLRGESLNALKDRSYGQINELEKLTSLIVEIKSKTPQEIKEIIKKRLEMAVKGLESIRVNDEEYAIIKNNIKKFTNSKIDFEELDNISSEGLRNTLDLFLRVSPALLKSSMFDRFFMENYYIKKMHLMGDTNIYTQAGNGIFNIFLNNTKYRYMEDSYKYEDSYISKRSSEQVKEIAKIPHFHTYWSKYFVLLYMYQEKMKPQIAYSSVDTLINFFSKHSTTQRYEENLIRLVLLGLSESRHGKIINIVLNNSDLVSKFVLSDKGKYILENEIWTFEYLSIIVDDIWLEYPSFLLDDFEFLQTVEDTFCHVYDEVEFAKHRKKTLLAKIKKIKLFLEILKISYKFEFKKVKRIIVDLNERTREDHMFILPNFASIENKVYNKMKEYAKNCGLDSSEIINLDSSLLNRKQKNKLEKFFKFNYALSLAFNKRDILSYHEDNILRVKEIVQKNDKAVPLPNTNTTDSLF